MSVDIAPSVKLSAKDRLKKLMEEESKMVTGIFRFHECPGGSVRIPMKKYPNQPTKTYDFADGEQYTVPLWVARWLNGYDALAGERNGKINACGVPIHSYAVDKATGVPLVTVGKVQRRMGFESNAFMV